MEVALTGSESVFTLRFGAGFNWFDHLGSGGFYAGSTAYPLHEQVTPPLDDLVSWAALETELTRLRPSIIRFGLPPDPHCDDEGNFRPGTVHLERLRRASRWAARNECSIILDTFVLPAIHALPRQGVPPEAMFQYAARSNRAYARSFCAPLLRHLTQDPDFSSIRWFNPVNEPMCYGIYSTHAAQGDLWEYYVDMYRELRSALDDCRVSRSRIGLIGIDHTSPNPATMVHQLGLTPSLDPYVDAYTLHYYYLRFDHLPPRPKIAPSAPIEDMIERQSSAVVQACRRLGKPLIAAEMGTFYNGWRHGDPAGVASFHTTLIVAEAMIRGLGVGLDGFAFWCLLNPNTIDGHFAILRVSDGKAVPLGWPARVYGTFTRLLRPGSRIVTFAASSHSEDVPHVHAVGIRSPDGTHSLLLVNDHSEKQATVSLSLPDGFSPAQGRLHTLNETGSEARLLPPFGEESSNALALSVPAFSLVVLTHSKEDF
ncbi:MAG: hypothetical protein SFV32_00130 [Opitutaceae bacterium]|nr:hypothetical protein [Opitutaceae bacterium]